MTTGGVTTGGTTGGGVTHSTLVNVNVHVVVAPVAVEGVDAVAGRGIISAVQHAQDRDLAGAVSGRARSEKSLHVGSLTQMLKTAFRYYFRTKLPVIRKALKLILAYNLTLSVTMVEGIGEDEDFLVMKNLKDVIEKMKIA